MRRIVDAIAAGVLISIGGCVFLACAGDGMKWLGAILFAVALLCICFKGYSLFTGKVGYLVNDHSKDYWHVVITSLIGNAIACCGVRCSIVIKPSTAISPSGRYRSFFSVRIQCAKRDFHSECMYFIAQHLHISGAFFVISDCNIRAMQRQERADITHVR